MKDVLINIKGTHSADGDNDTVEMTTVGTLSIADGRTSLSYDETAAIGVDGVTTTVNIENSQVSLQRSGSIGGRLLVEKGQRHLCHYDTAAGEIMIGVFGESVQHDISENGGRLYMRYTIDVNYGLVSRNELEISVSVPEN